VVAVAQVDKGQGVRSGDRLAVGFTSHLKFGQLRERRAVSGGCGHVAGTIQEGDWLRLYLGLDQGGHFVADFPQSFLRLDRPMTDDGSEGVTGPILLVIAAVMVATLAAWRMVRSRRDLPATLPLPMPLPDQAELRSAA
jgi:hypothetical protein